jgi:hypothetical protein
MAVQTEILKKNIKDLFIPSTLLFKRGAEERVQPKKEAPAALKELELSFIPSTEFAATNGLVTFNFVNLDTDVTMNIMVSEINQKTQQKTVISKFAPTILTSTGQEVETRTLTHLPGTSQETTGQVNTIGSGIVGSISVLLPENKLTSAHHFEIEISTDKLGYKQKKEVFPIQIKIQEPEGKSIRQGQVVPVDVKCRENEDYVITTFERTPEGTVRIVSWHTIKGPKSGTFNVPLHESVKPGNEFVIVRELQTPDHKELITDKQREGYLVYRVVA